MIFLTSYRTLKAAASAVCGLVLVAPFLSLQEAVGQLLGVMSFAGRKRGHQECYKSVGRWAYDTLATVTQRGKRSLVCQSWCAELDPFCRVDVVVYFGAKEKAAAPFI